MQPFTDFLNFGNIFFNDKTYSPDTIRVSIDAVAGNLTKRFISNSPFVYLFAPNHIKTVYALFGIIKAGKVCVLVDPALKHFELEDMMKDSPPGALIRVDRETDVFDFSKEIEVKHDQLNPSRIQGLDDVAIMLYTAAEDGYAKGAMLTHENILANARAGVECISNCIDSSSCAMIPFHHLFAVQTGLIIPSLIYGNILIVDCSQLLSVNKIGDHIENCKIASLYSTPIVYYLLKRLPNPRNIFRDAQSITSGGYRLPIDLSRSYQIDIGREIHEGYGITEASPICTWHRPYDTVKSGSIGHAFPCCEVKILNDQNLELPIGQEGEICVKGINVFKGYLFNEVATKNILIDGWLHTGDLGVIDAEGYVFIKSLKKRMLNVSGNKVYPAELERLMKKHDNVLNVEVYGEPDELLGDKVKAKVRLQNNTTETQKIYKEWCLENITRYKVPKNIEFLS